MKDILIMNFETDKVTSVLKFMLDTLGETWTTDVALDTQVLVRKNK